MGVELTLTVGPAANGGSCVARHEGRVVFVRYALPGERVRARVTADRDAYWHADAIEILEPSEHRIASLCPIAGPHGAGCCDLAFAEPAYARRLKGEVVANQLLHVGGIQHEPLVAQAVGSGQATGWRTRVRLAVGPDGGVGYRRYHSTDLLPAPGCGQLAPGLLDGLEKGWPPASELHVVLDDEGRRNAMLVGPHRGPARGRGRAVSGTRVVEGRGYSVQRVGHRSWIISVTGFWQAHREAAATYSRLVAEWADLGHGMTAWDLYGGAGVFAAVLAEGVGAIGEVISVDSSRSATAAARNALGDLPQVTVVTNSVRRMLEDRRERPDLAVLDPPRRGAGRAVLDLLARTGVPRVIHIGCEVASFARDLGLYRERGYTVADVAVFDSFPLTHHVECVALLTRRAADQR